MNKYVSDTILYCFLKHITISCCFSVIFSVLCNLVKDRHFSILITYAKKKRTDGGKNLYFLRIIIFKKSIFVSWTYRVAKSDRTSIKLPCFIWYQNFDLLFLYRQYKFIISYPEFFLLDEFMVTLFFMKETSKIIYKNRRELIFIKRTVLIIPFLYLKLNHVF